MIEDVFSPGHALSERASLERGFESQMMWSVSSFLAAVANDPRMSSGEVHGQWAKVIEVVGVCSAAYLDVPAPVPGRAISNEFLQNQQRRMRANPLPDLVHTTALAVWAEGGDVREALSLDTSSVALTAALGFVGRTWRAIVSLFVRTESTAMKNTELMFKLLDKGVKEKRWVAHHDDLTRATHRAADGQVQLLNQPFEVGTARLQYPGVNTGPNEEILNCRCVIVGVKGH